MVFFFLPSLTAFSSSTPDFCIHFMIGYVVGQENWYVAAGKPVFLSCWNVSDLISFYLITAVSWTLLF